MRIYVSPTDYDLLLINESGIDLSTIFKQAMAAKANHINFKLNINCSALIGKKFSPVRVSINEGSIPESIANILAKFPDESSKGDFLKAIARSCIDYDCLLGLSEPQQAVSIMPAPAVKTVEMKREKESVPQKPVVHKTAPEKPAETVPVKEKEPETPAMPKAAEPAEDNHNILEWNGIKVDINDTSDNPLKSLESEIDYPTNAHDNVSEYCVYFYMRMNGYVSTYEENRKSGKKTDLQALWNEHRENVPFSEVVQRRINKTRKDREEKAQQPEQKPPMKLSQINQIRSNLMRSGSGVVR